MQAGPSRADIDGGLVVYWPLDADADDATGDGNVGIIKGAVTPTTDRFDHHDGALHFYCEPTACAERWSPWVLPRAAITIAAWVRPDTLDHDGRIVAIEGNCLDMGRCSLQLVAGGVVRCEFARGESDVIQASSQLPVFGAPRWFHVVGVFRPGEALELWLDSRLVASQPAATMSLFSDSSGWMRVGGPGCWWGGAIDEVRLYARSLSPAEVNGLYTFAPAPHLKAWAPYPPDGAVGVTEPDVSWRPGATAFLCNVYFGTTPPGDFVGVGLEGGITEPWLPALEPGTTYYWRVDEIEVDRKTAYTGDVWRFTTKPYTAFDPWPADSANSVSCEMDLSWSAGVGATLHEVYFGTDPGALAKGTRDMYESGADRARYNPGPLRTSTKYYWRVDEIGKPDPNGPTGTQVGPVWSFTTAQLPVIDDFERYDGDYLRSDNDEYPGCSGHELCCTWIDGWGYEEPVPRPGPYSPEPPSAYAERTIVHGGRQSMVFDYNNAVEPCYCEFERTFESSQDWTTDGADTLVLYVRGVVTNDPEPLYIGIQDAAARVCVATHPDCQVLMATQWVEWKIPLESMTGVNPVHVKKVFVGVGNRDKAKRGGLGWVFVDDIQVIQAVPQP
jgi:hypothetical protein